MGGAGGSLRAGVTENPVRLTHSVKDLITRVTCGGAPVYVWPGGGITVMVDVLRMPDRAFGYVPTPALVLPIEFTMPLAAYAAMGGHVGNVTPLTDALRGTSFRVERIALKSLVLPSGAIGAVVRRLAPKADGAAIPLALPREVADIRVTAGRITLYKAAR